MYNLRTAPDNSELPILCIMYMCRRQFNSQSFSDITFAILQFSFIFFLAPKSLVIHSCFMTLLVTTKMRNFHSSHRALSPPPKKNLKISHSFLPTTYFVKNSLIFSHNVVFSELLFIKFCMFTFFSEKP